MGGSGAFGGWRGLEGFGMSQNQQVLARLKSGPLTSLQAIRELGVTRLSARIYDLGWEGHRIEWEWATVRTRHGKTRVKRYFLAD